MLRLWKLRRQRVHIDKTHEEKMAALRSKAKLGPYELSQEEFDGVVRALGRYGVVRFPGQRLTGRQLAEFQRERNRIEGLMQMDPVTSRVAQAN